MQSLEDAVRWGLGAVSYALATENKPAKVIVTDVDDAKLARANEVISVEEAKEKGVDLIYVNTVNMEDPAEELKALSVDGKGFDDVFVYVRSKVLQNLEIRFSIRWMHEFVCRTDRF